MNAMYNAFIREIHTLVNPELFYQLSKVGGHKRYHLEGNALRHTYLVWQAALKKWGEGHFMVKVALLHDVGKLWGKEFRHTNDWGYPMHSVIGAAELDKFVRKDDAMFLVYQWYIENHIKPLYWRENMIKYGSRFCYASLPPEGLEEYCTLDNLRHLALCDLAGSWARVPQRELINWLTNLKFESK